MRTSALPALLSLCCLVGLGLGLPAAGCLPPDEPAEDTRASSAPSTSTAASPHEPMIELAPVKLTALAAPRFSLAEIDRPFRLSFNWWSNGTPHPSLFRLTGRSPSGAVTSSGEPSSAPVLDVTPLPGETTLTVDIEHTSQAPEVRMNLLLEQQILPSELGRCGDQIRDLFVRWVHARHPWRGNPWYTHAHESPPAAFSFGYSQGVGLTSLDYRLRGVLAGSRGPILQVEHKSGGRLRLNALLFFDEQGQLLRQVDGLYYFTLSDGNLLVSSGMANDGSWSTPWYQTIEAVMAVTPAGEIAWQRQIGGKPPGRVVTTAAGALIMPWALDEAGSRTAAIPELDPRSGATVDETFVDRGELCTELSAAPACVEARPRVTAQFEAWWAQTWRAYLPSGWPVGPRQACDAYTCYAGVLAGWTRLGAEDVLEVAMHGTSTIQRSRNWLLFFDGATRRSLGGKLLRRLGPDRLLVSTAMADSGGVSSSGEIWYSAQEKLAAVGAGGAIAWQRQVGGPLALVYPPAPSASAAADGYLLPQHQLFWTAWAMRNGILTAQNLWLDLATGATLPTPARRVLEGVCAP